MLNEKKLFWIFLVIAMIIVGGMLFMPRQSGLNDPGPRPERAVDPTNPNFIMGKVTSASPERVEFMSGPNSYSAIIGPNTKLVKQAVEEGLVQVVDAASSDMTADSMIVVYFSSPAVNNIYQADKIQIIN